MKITYKRYFLALSALCCCFAYSCKKNSIAPATPATPATPAALPYTITCWGKEAGTITNFMSDNSKYDERWTFGDGDTLSVNASQIMSRPWGHVYKAPGIYTVTLVVNNDIANKVTEQDTIRPNFWPHFIGLPMVGETLFFKFSAFLPPGVSYLWTFGDGATSTDSTPHHVYTAEGNFVLRLTINGNPAEPNIWMQIPICKDPVHTPAITNMRLWHGTQRTQYLSSGSFDNTVSLPDTSFAIKFVDELTLSYNRNAFKYTPSLSSGNILVYSSANNSYKASTITYNFATDTIGIYLYSLGGGHGNPICAYETRWHTP